MVLDTNAVLALWWFEDPATEALRRAVEAADLRVLGCERTRAELVHVLARGLPARRGTNTSPPASATLLATLDRLTAPCPTPPPALRLRCSDPSDQVFIDLAVAEGAAWLFSRDRAVLRLRRRATALGGPLIRVPDGWCAPPATDRASTAELS